MISVAFPHSPDYLSRLGDAVDEFMVAFDSWMETQVESHHMQAGGMWPTVWAREDADETEVKQLTLAVAEAAGLAAKAVAVTGAYFVVAGIGTIDPIANWSTMEHPKALLAPADVRATAATIKGRLRALQLEAEASRSDGMPAFGPFALHATIWSAAAPHWTTHQYRVAVREAAEALTAEWRDKLGRYDEDGTSFWQQTLSAGEPSEGRPKLVWPGEADDKTVKSVRVGIAPLARALNDLATGLNLTVRNTTTHDRNELSEQEALERLGAYSYLARLLDQCEIRYVEG